MHYLERFKKCGRIKNELARNLLAEFFGTALLRVSISVFHFATSNCVFQVF